MALQEAGLVNPDPAPQNWIVDLNTGLLTNVDLGDCTSIDAGSIANNPAHPPEFGCRKA